MATPPVFTAGEVLPAADLQQLATALTPVTDTSIGTNASGFTASVQIARTLAFGKLVYINIVTVNTAAVTASGSPADFGSTAIFTLDAAYRPTEPTGFEWTTGAVGGNGLIATSGVVTLETTTGTIAISSTIRCGGAVFILA